MQIGREKAVRLNFAGNVVSQDRNPQGTSTEKCWNKLIRSQNNSVLFLLEENNQKTQIVRFIPPKHTTPLPGNGGGKRRGYSLFICMSVLVSALGCFPHCSSAVQFVGKF